MRDVISGKPVSFAFYQGSIRSYFTSVCFKNLLLHLSSYLCVVARSVVNIQHSIGCLVHGLVVFSWYAVITCESSVHTFIRFFLQYSYF